MSTTRIAVIGGGAAGFFAAIACAQNNPSCQVTLFEKSNKLLAKVKVSGGGRCNVTHHCFEPAQLIKFYPRGSKALKPSFQLFGAQNTVQWFEQRGVKLKTEADGRMFPVTDDSQTIIDCLLREADKTGVEVKISYGIASVEKMPEGNFKLLSLDKKNTLYFDKVIIASGGHPQARSYDWLQQLGHTVVSPVPSLFTFNISDKVFTELQGVSVPQAEVKIAASKLEQDGPVLVTHWGFSGPAILKLSAWGARELHDKDYNFRFFINWAHGYTETTLRTYLDLVRAEHPKKIIAGNPLFGLPARLWKLLTELAEIEPDRRWMDLPKKNSNKLVETLLRGNYEAKGKTTFKEEFVTAGGISLAEVNMQTLESKLVPGLYFAGEVLDIDGITGGFNFQAAWTTGYLAGKAASKALQ
jgi:predicted Rossmann fold flavoprotein